MSIFNRTLRLAAAGALALFVCHCSLDGECLRYSDCADGLTCAAGRCVPPPGSAQGGGDSAAAAATDAAVASDSGADEGEASED